MRTGFSIFLLLVVATAGEPDASRAGVERWTHPRGSAACNARSFARAPETFGGIVWTYKATREIVAPPLTWDGAAFVLDGTSLVALDTENGRVIARTGVKVDRPERIAAHDRAFFCVEESQLVQYRLRGRALARGWSFKVGDRASAPRIVEGEIYVATAGALMRLRAGAGEAEWSAKGDFVGDPAVYDEHVYALRRAAGELQLALYARADGKEAGALALGRAADARDGAIVITKTILGVRRPGSPDTWTLVRRKPAAKRGPPELELSRNEKFASQPSTGRETFLALTAEPRTWCFLTMRKKQPRIILIKGKRPDLHENTSDPTSLNWPTVCFGTWAGNVNSMRILWHLNERPDLETFKKGVRFHAVPARHELLLLVPRDAKTLHAIGPEEIE